MQILNMINLNFIIITINRLYFIIIYYLIIFPDITFKMIILVCFKLFYYQKYSFIVKHYFKKIW